MGMRRHRWWVLALVAVAAVVAIAVAIGNTGSSDETPLSSRDAVVPTTPETVELDPAARRVAKRFVLTAVARTHLREAYELAGPGIRQGQTLREWLTGEIAVTPYPVAKLDYAPMKIDYSYPREALVEIALLPTKTSGEKPQLFMMGLKKLDGRWRVDSWVPRSTFAVPSTH
jgi:hypothetical protein